TQCPASVADLVFPNDAGDVESHDDLLAWFRRLQLANGTAKDSAKREGQGTPAGEAKYGLHALRHAAASLFIAHLGWTPKKLQTVMGHSSITMTFDRYGHLFEDHESDRDAMKKLEAAVVAA